MIRLSSSYSSSTSADDTIIPEEFVKRYKLQGETLPKNKSGVRLTTETGHTVQTDVPKRMGGQDTAPQPVELLLAAWMGCTQATALFVGRQMSMNKKGDGYSKRFVLERLVFQDIQGERDERGALTLPIDEAPSVPSRLQRIHGTIIVYRAGGLPISNEEMTLLREQTESRCPVANMMIASGCRMDVDWIDGSTLVSVSV